MVELEDVSTYISLAFLFLVGLGLGASTTFDDFRKACAKPKAVGVGFLSQYLFMPILSYILTVIFQVDDRVAIGAVLVGCSPGGTTSNLFTYWSSGDVALSITMSFLSTVAAFFMMPFWIWIFVIQILDSEAELAWSNMIAGLVLILVPTIFGLMVRRYNTQYKLGGKFLWKWIELFASVMGILFLIASVVIAIVTYNDFFKECPWQVWIMGGIMQPVGCAFGYNFSSLLGLSQRDMRTIAWETGLQSFTLTIAVIQLTFEDDDDVKQALYFPLAYGFLYFFWSPMLTWYYRRNKIEDDVDLPLSGDTNSTYEGNRSQEKPDDTKEESETKDDMTTSRRKDDMISSGGKDEDCREGNNCLETKGGMDFSV